MPAGPLDAYERFDFDDGRRTRPVYRRGSGPGAIVVHEMPGLHPLAVRFADRVADAGLTVFLPSLFGTPGREVSPGYAAREMLKGICIRREFAVWATDRSSPIVDWLRALAARVHGECGGRGVGAVGMCFTGGFALAMATEPAVVAPVVSQPSLPLAAFSSARAASIGLSESEIACVRERFEAEDLSALGLRFRGDPFVPDARFARYRREFGERFEAIELDPADARPDTGTAPHSVLTIHLADDGPTRDAERRTIEFLKRRTAPAGPPEAGAPGSGEPE